MDSTLTQSSFLPLCGRLHLVLPGYLLAQRILIVHWHCESDNTKLTIHHIVKCSPLKNIFWLTFGLLTADGWTNKLLLRLELRLRELIKRPSGITLLYYSAKSRHQEIH